MNTEIKAKELIKVCTPFVHGYVGSSMLSNTEYDDTRIRNARNLASAMAGQVIGVLSQVKEIVTENVPMQLLYNDWVKVQDLINAVKPGLDLISEERARQVHVLGYNREHDLQYQNQELYRAAVCYYEIGRRRESPGYNQAAVPDSWPFAAEHWKPSPDNRARELVKAGALLMAQEEITPTELIDSMINVCAKEIDRLNGYL